VIVTNHYRTLGVATTVGKSEIKVAYHKLALDLHPDKTGRLPEDERDRRQDLPK
ncbi:hypothetical protein BS50DRAFT_490627, partial [Corynespora cassiicola Philippines]